LNLFCDINYHLEETISLGTKENTYTNACNEEYYNPLKTLETKNKDIMDIEGVNVKQGRDNSKLTKTVVERINVKTQKTQYNNIGEKK